jgi:hypothetical protein
MCRCLCLARAQIGGGEDRLALEVALLDRVIVDQREGANPAAARYCSEGEPMPPQPIMVIWALPSAI